MPPANQDPHEAFVIAIPVADGRLSLHFGHCERFAIFDVDRQAGEVLNRRDVEPPLHQPGVLPRWLHDQGVKLVISGGMGGRAIQIFNQFGVDVLLGASAEPPEAIVADFLADRLATGDNICDH